MPLTTAAAKGRDPTRTRWRGRRLVCALLVFVGVVGGEDDRAARDVGDPVLQKRIHDAIDKGVAHLKSIQRRDGYWGGDRDRLGSGDLSNVGGMTALCLYALAASGVPKDDPAIVRGVRFVLDHDDAFGPGRSCTTYANALLAMALTRIDPDAYQKAIHEAADRLVDGQLSDGMWTYGPRQTGPPARAGDRTAWRKANGSSTLADNSNTQFAVLALWAARKMAGYEVPRGIWERIHEHFVKTQERDGGWSYRKNDRNSTATMTAAGIVSLVYAVASLDGKEGALERARGHPAVKQALPLVPLTPERRTRIGTWGDYYLVYSIERVGTVLDLDIESWYVPGAQWLIEQQQGGGGWLGGWDNANLRGKDPGAEEHPYGTSLALLFLTRATMRAVTTGGKDKAEEGPVTRKDTGPEDLAGLFDLYVATRADDRATLLPRFARREAVALVIGKLRDKRQPVREAAFELLSRLVERPFLFDPAATLEEREMMLGPIEAFWKEKGERLERDEASGRFVVR